MKLEAGERIIVKDGQLALVQNGKCEAYAVTSQQSEYRQMFLMELESGQAAVPAMDEFGQIEIMLYAELDSELMIASMDSCEADRLAEALQFWFCQLSQLSWIKLLIDRGDDMLSGWGSDKMFIAVDSKTLIAEFVEHQQIFSMLLGVRFKAEDKRLGVRMKVRSQQKQLLVNEAIANLLDEEPIMTSHSAGGNTQLEEAEFIVRRVAAALAMPTDNIGMQPELVRRLDQLGVIRRLVQKGNMQLRLVNLQGDWYKKDSGVLLGYFGEKKELAAVLPTEPGSYKLVTMREAEGRILTDELAAQLDSDAFVCYAGFPTRRLKVLDLMKFMLRQCWKNDYRIIIMASIFAGLIPLVTPVITESIFQDIIPILDRQGLATVTQVAMVTSFTMAAISIVRSIAVMRITTHLDMATEAALWSRLLSLPTKFFRQFQTGELVQRMSGIEAIKSVVNGQFASAVCDFVFSFWSLLLMCYYSLKLTAAAVAVWIVYCVVTAFIYRRVINFQRKMIDASNKTAGIVQQIFSGLAKFRVQGAEEQAYYLWSRAFGEEWKWNLKLRWQNNYNVIIGAVQPFILTMLLYYIAVYGMETTGADGKTIQGITYAEFLAFSAAYSSFNGTLNSVIPLIGQFFSIQPHIENLRPILNEVPEVSDDKIDADVLSGAIEVSHLTFAYKEGLPDVLHDISFRVAAGEHIAIVGRSGCGKSTLVRLLLGFEEPRQGAVFYDGQDLAELSLSSVRSQLGVVLQNGQLMTGDIFTNIVGTTTLTLDDAWRAAEAAGIADDIREMPMGMQTVISEGSSNISGGQRQRLLIARALACRPPIIIFDEATSALDNRTQAIVTESLNNTLATKIVVAHRLSTIRDADRILVMDKGEIAESGSFAELAAKGGIFSELIKRQAV